MDYISLFSGAGGLEGPSSPLVVCEIDRPAQDVLRRRFPDSSIHDDVTTMEPPEAEVVAGGWPCQDISVAGLRRGLSGDRSGLFFELLRIAEQAQAHTIIAENVPHLLRLEGGGAFDLVLESLAASGYGHVAWRTINARQFGLPHERRRVFLVASKHRDIAMALHRPIESAVENQSGDGGVAGFYWTAGLHSICYTKGFVPTLKVGSSLSIPSPPAIHFDGTVRKLTADEAVRLQGFAVGDFQDVRPKDMHRMAGNAVAVPVGGWVFDSLMARSFPDVHYAGFGFTAQHGIFEGGQKRAVEHEPGDLATNLGDFVDRTNTEPISPRAAAGLVRRLVRSGKPCPDDLLRLLLEAAEPLLEAEIALVAEGSVESRPDPGQLDELEQPRADDGTAPLPLFDDVA